MDEECGICGETIPRDKFGYPEVEVGEFWDPKANDSVIAHAQCGLDAELELA